MKLKVINSNSKGNAYLLEGDDTALLIECGVPFSQIKEAIDFNLVKIDLCVVTHEHRDHSRCINQIIESGIVVVSSRGTFDALKIPKESRGIEINHGGGCKYQAWQIKAFDVDHDANKPLGFVIHHHLCGKILFVTDTYVLKWKLPFDFDHVIIEANYDEEIAKQWADSKGTAFVENRRLTNHMSLQTAHKTLESLDLSNCKNIVLIHLSDGLTHERQFQETTEKIFGIKTTVAGPGVEVDFNVEPF